jgi:hypothetical protein
VLSILLALLVGLQGMPLQSLVQSVQHGAVHHECSHPDGVCPMNPDGPCQCNHDTPSSPDEPTLQSCSNSGPIAVLSLALPKWVPTVGTPIPAPDSDDPLRTPHRLVLSSQRVGDDVFRPPPVQAAQRPARTLQASGSA